MPIMLEQAPEVQTNPIIPAASEHRELLLRKTFIGVTVQGVTLCKKNNLCEGFQPLSPQYFNQQPPGLDADRLLLCTGGYRFLNKSGRRSLRT